MDRIRGLAVAALCLAMLTATGGCAGLKERLKGVAGVSTREIEEARPRARGREFNCDFFSCYRKSEDVLKRQGAYIYARQKDLLALYVSDTDTTPVGVYFVQLDKLRTRVEVSSPSTYAKELISGGLFAGLEKAFVKKDVSVSAAPQEKAGSDLFSP